MIFYYLKMNLRRPEVPNTDMEPFHPPLRFFVLLSGLAHVTLPDGSDEAWIVEGVNGLIVAADTMGVGHHTAYPSDKETVALQIPFAAGVVPRHEVLKQGACHSSSQVLAHGDDSSTTALLADEL